MSSAAHIALAEAVDRLEAEFGTKVHTYVWTKPQEARAPTGERYIQFIEGPHETAESAIASWLASALHRAKHAPEGSTLYWRIRPEINCFKGRRGGFRIYSRFLISNKPHARTS